MRGMLIAAAVISVAVAAALAGTAGARGGNHGCVQQDRLVYSDHFFESGDNVVAGFYTEEIKLPPSTEESFVVENSGNDGAGPSGLSCGANLSTWSLFRSRLGHGDDSVRLDAVGLQNKYPVPPGPLPSRIGTVLNGGAGDDVMRGHVGFDDISGNAGHDVLRPEARRDRVLGGGGPDLIKAADGFHDGIQCGGGRDKAIVDKRDDVRGCERVVERSG